MTRDVYTNPCVCVSGQGKNCLPEPRGKEKTARRQGVCNYTHRLRTATTTATAYLPTLVRYRFNTLQRCRPRNYTKSVPFSLGVVRNG